MTVQIKIKVKAGELEAQLKQNLAQHQADYRDAMSGYWDKYQERLERALGQLKVMIDPEDRGPSESPLQGLVKPKSYEDDYKVAISMMERVDDSTEVELDTEQYRQLWMDDWGWKQAFTTTNSMYTS